MLEPKNYSLSAFLAEDFMRNFFILQIKADYHTESSLTPRMAGSNT